jgi:hypothetical protein
MREPFLMFLGFVLLLSPLPVIAHEYLINGAVPHISVYGGIQITALTAGTWDEGYYDLALPADNQFYFYGRKVTDLRIFTNGYVTFGFGAPPSDTSFHWTNASIPDTGVPNGYAAPWWDDWNLDPATGAGEIWLTTSIDSGFIFTSIEWKDVAHHSDSTARYSFGVIFFAESDWAPWSYFYRNCIAFFYKTVNSGTGTYDAGKFGTVGIEHYDGTQGAFYSYNTASVTTSNDVLFTPFVAAYDSTDFNYGSTVDIMIYRPSQGVWKINDTGAAVTQTIYFGGAYDVPLPGDFDGDGAADPCIFRPSQSRWRVQGPDMDVQFGKHGDIPVPADFNGDGKTDIAVFRPITGMWRIRYTGTGTQDTVFFGTQGDIPVPYDYDGDLKADVAIVRPGANLLWRIQYSNGGSGSFYYGLEGDIPVPGDWDSNPRIAIWRPSDGKWRIKDVAASWATFSWGVSGDVALPGDFDRGGYTDWAIWRPSLGMWRIAEDTDTNYTYYWGKIGDIPRFRRSGAVRAVGGGAGQR